MCLRRRWGIQGCRRVFAVVLVVEVGGGAEGKIVTPDWRVDAETIAASEQGLMPLDPPFDSLYGFASDSEELAIVVLELIHGDPSALHDYLENVHGPGVVQKPMELWEGDWFYVVEFANITDNTRILFDWKGARCAVIFTPLE